MRASSKEGKEIGSFKVRPLIKENKPKRDEQAVKKNFTFEGAQDGTLRQV